VEEEWVVERVLVEVLWTDILELFDRVRWVGEYSSGQVGRSVRPSDELMVSVRPLRR